MVDVATAKRKVRGVDFIVDDAGEKKAVIIDLRRHKGLGEDFYDTVLANERATESRESLEQVKKRVLRKY